jgi:hypothetical protein
VHGIFPSLIDDSEHKQTRTPTKKKEKKRKKKADLSR